MDVCSNEEECFNLFKKIIQTWHKIAGMRSVRDSCISETAIWRTSNMDNIQHCHSSEGCRLATAVVSDTTVHSV